MIRLRDIENGTIFKIVCSYFLKTSTTREQGYEYLCHPIGIDENGKPIVQSKINVWYRTEEIIQLVNPREIVEVDGF